MPETSALLTESLGIIWVAAMIRQNPDCHHFGIATSIFYTYCGWKMQRSTVPPARHQDAVPHLDQMRS